MIEKTKNNLCIIYIKNYFREKDENEEMEEKGKEKMKKKKLREKLVEVNYKFK